MMHGQKNTKLVLLHVCSFGDRLQGPKPCRMQYWMRDDILTAVNIQMADWK